MEKVLAWVFGIIGFVVIVVGGFLYLKDGGLAAALYERDAELNRHPDADAILKAWETDIEKAAASDVPAADAKPKGGVVETVAGSLIEQLPEPSAALEAAKSGATSLKDRLSGN